LALITTRVPAGRSDHWLGYYSVSGTIGVLFLMLAVGAIAALGWRYVFLLFLLAVPVGLMIGLTLRGDGGGVAARSAGEQPQPPPSGIPWVITLFAALCGAIVTTIAMYLPYHLADIGYGSPDTVAMLMVAGAGVAAVPALAFGWIRARFSAIQVFAASFTIITIGVVVIVVARDLPLIFLGMALHGLGMGAMMPNLFSACAASTTPEQRARMLGFVRAGIYAGPLLVQPGLEVIMASSGATAVLSAIGAASLLAGVLSVTGRGMFNPVATVSAP
jgi:MFS family permease